MVEIARDAAGPDVIIEGFTAGSGSPLITCGEELSTAASAVADLIRAGVVHDFDGVVISAFGDPGIDEARELLNAPVVGLAEASLREAAEFGGKFSVATTTPQLIPAMSEYIDRQGLGDGLQTIRATQGNLADVMSDAAAMESALTTVVEEISASGDVRSIIIGGGPLAGAARSLAADSAVHIIEPIPAAIRLVLKQLQVAKA